jgi:cyclopropane-fatty-acyl-phospholipid synthase
MGLAESYMRDEWSTNDLTALLQLLYRADADRAAFKSLLASTTGRIARWLERLWGNTIARSRRQIAAHYDLSNEFFQLMLDPTMMYSSGYFKSPDMTLEEASVAKLDQICRKLDLQPGQKLLEIGSGWGGFGLHAVSRYSAKLTTTTISRAQFDLAQSRFAAAGIADQVELKLEDYRNLQGSFDRLVSIEMIEAVGEQNLDTYFRKCGQLLRPGGRMVIQAIVMPEQRYADYCRGVDFIQKYIFPGGFLPSITAMQHSVGRTTDWRLQNLEDLTSHYARTLLEWRRRFMDQIEAVKQLGFDDRFIRMWEYYLCYCEAAFREQAVRVVQIVWERPPVQP